MLAAHQASVSDPSSVSLVSLVSVMDISINVNQAINVPSLGDIMAERVSDHEKLPEDYLWTS